MMESAWSQLGRVGLTSNASMIGKLLALGAQRCKLQVCFFLGVVRGRGRG